MLMYVLNDRSLKFIDLFLFKMIWRLTWSILIKRRNGYSPESDTWNYPTTCIGEIPPFFICIVIEKPPFPIWVDSLLFIDCIISIGTYGFKCARNNTRIPSIFALCLNFELSSILKWNIEINLENEFKKYLRTIWRYTNFWPKIIFENYDFFDIFLPRLVSNGQQ